MKKIIEIYKSQTNPVFSFEFFPPKTQEGENKLKSNISELKTMSPAFVSVTYGAGGSTKDKTIELCETIQKDFHITTMCHYTCVGVGKEEILKTLSVIESKGIQNIIALRGDPPKGTGKFIPHPHGFKNATELIAFIKKNQFDFCIAGGCYPEKHPDSPTLDDDILNLKKKVDAGAEFLITQLFFVNEVFYKFLEKTKKVGIHVPIIPGIMPITSFNQIQKFKELANCEIPLKLLQDLEKLKEDPKAFLQRSVEFTIEQCRNLIEEGVKGIHFYTLNESNATIQIMKNLS